MHPAFSIILFTSLSGLGYGLAAWLGLGALDPSRMATKLAHVLALALIGGGLLSSTLHLGNPQRAWRAFSQWRSSWLSREGVLAILTFVPLCWSAWLAIIEGRWHPVPGTAGAVLAVITVFSTSMIYASLKSVDAWHTPLTPAAYLAFAAASGAAAAAAFAYAGGADQPGWLGAAAILLLLAAWAIKLAWRRRLDAPPTSTPESATGLGGLGKVRLSEPPHTNPNYLTREMGFRVARKHARKLWMVALVTGCAVPLAILAALAVTGAQPGPASASAAAVALVFAIGGIMVERWLFFAEARHAVMNFYR